MSDRKEERERLRRERLAAERSATGDERRRLIFGYLGAGVIVAIVVVGIAVAIFNGGSSGAEGAVEVNEAAGIDPSTGVILPAGAEPDEREGAPPPEIAEADPKKAAEAAGCKLRLGLEEEGNKHLAPGDKEPKYKSSPPTSGSMAETTLADGAYLDPVDQTAVLHSLEHGRIAFQYSPDLAEDDQLALKGLFDTDPQGMILTPNPEMPYAVAAAAWTNAIVCDSYTPEAIDALRAFREEFRGQGPESVPL